VGVFVVIWCGNGGSNPPFVLRDSSFLPVILVPHLCCDFRFWGKFFVLCHDLIFPEFESISGDDFWGLGSSHGEFRLCKIWERFVVF
jgi:hypothetical protein